VAGPGLEGSDRDFFPIVEDTKVFLLEISNGQPVLRVLADDIDKD